MKLSIALMALLVVAAVLAAPNMGNGAADKGIDSAERGGFKKCTTDSDCDSGKCYRPREICYDPHQEGHGWHGGK